MAKGGRKNELTLQAGEIYSFKTPPATRFSPPDTGRYGALKVLGIGRFDAVCVVTLDGIFTSPPRPSDVAALQPMSDRSRMKGSGFESVGVVPAQNGDWTPREFKLVTRTEVTEPERRICETNNSFGALIGAAVVAELGWRERNDAENYRSEAQREEGAKRAEHAERVRRRNTRLKKLTCAQLRSEPLLADWSPSPPFPPQEFIDAARERILRTIEEIETFGDKPRRADVRTVMRQLVEWLNQKDEEFGGVIETEERERLCVVIEELCWAARQPALVDEITELREW